MTRFDSSAVAERPAGSPADRRTVPGQLLSSATTLYRNGQLDEAESGVVRLLELDPRNHQAMEIAGLVARQRQQWEEAADWFRRAIESDPTVPAYHLNIGCILNESGARETAEEALREAIRLRPNWDIAWRNLGACFQGMGKLEEALDAHRKAVAANPNYLPSHLAVGDLLKKMGRGDEAETAFRAAIALDPTCTKAYHGLCSIVTEQGRLVEVIDVQRKIVELEPQDSSAHSNLLFTLHYDNRQTPRDLYDESVRWAQRHSQPNAQHARPLSNDRTIGRRLRIGYLSPDFRDHVVSRIFRPTLKELDRARVEVFCYSDARFTDAVTQEVWRLADHWRGTYGMSDEALAELIRQDQIDLLVEMCGHFGGNRLAMLGGKPAPLVISQVGSCGTSGVTTIDYRFTDAYSDPPGAEQFYSEELWRLPDCGICYHPPEETPDVGPLPARSTGRITFGIFNNALKITDEVIAAWARVLHAVPESKLLMLGRREDRYNPQRLARHGILDERLEFAGRCSRFDYLNLHNRVDIALDTFPFNGDNTTCDALWMGVPVVAMTGAIFAARRSFSHLSNVGLGDLAANTVEEYVRIAVEIANDLPHLEQLRAQLRPRMIESTLGNPARYARNLESAYLEMWRRWCETRTA